METMEELIQLAEAQGSEEESLPFWERAVRLADTQRDIEAGFRTRTELVHAATFSGHPNKALVHFAWLIGTFDKNRELFKHREMYLMWAYKWILHSIFSYPNFSLQRAYQLQEDFERRTRQLGSGSHYHAYQSLRLALHIGDLKAAEQAFLAWRRIPRDDLSDCEVCEKNKVMGYYEAREDYLSSVRLGEEILRSDRKCHNVPTVTYGSLLYPLFKLGRLDEARQYHLEGVTKARGDRNFIPTIAEHVQFLVLTENLDAALRLWMDHFQLGYTTRDPLDRFDFVLAGAALFQVLAEKRSSLHLIFPGFFQGYSLSGEYDPTALSALLLKEAQELAQQYDTRNGTDRFRQLIEQWMDRAATQRQFFAILG
ncbi:hypothetical protein [Deinococcus cellulosilyticus]|uniref:Tetratricopeptide repeat protein n=1 Tax=Deinococcus cellulosilyticus (strain DSM 18568 / NBRC 106333 / KACC 11606 / 5516J-15) TaxID=1223518 RepID=A0A511MXQ7_DEIC1|nr:hypothetical protein [Deinococcus cellulosilyticus]GEM44937.1 hypothetical protein DC3_05720 [Deinococcus cellulosilyticus NBRC 106333 = KACC 11606]